MLCDTSTGARHRDASAPGSARRLSESRKWLIGLLYLAAGSVWAQAASSETSTPSLSEPCSSAKAVHDMRCPNYTGFKNWTGAGAPAAQPATESTDALAVAVPAESVADAAPKATAANKTEPRAARSKDEPGLLSSLLRAGRDLQRGVASWYGPGFHGRTTANGEKYNMHEFTAAHKTLPFGTRVLVHNPRTGKEVVVRINDRGPYAKGRVIDLSKAAATVLGIRSRGHDAVVLREALPATGKRGGEMIATSDSNTRN